MIVFLWVTSNSKYKYKLKKQTEFIPTEDLINKFSDQSDIKTICDLGSSVPIAIFKLMESLSIEKAIPVDIDKIPELGEVYFGGGYLEESYHLKDELDNKSLYEKFDELKTPNFLYNEYLKTSLIAEKSPCSKERFSEIISDKQFGNSIHDFVSKTEETFDLIIASKSLSHIQNEQHQNRVLNKIAKLLKTQGYLYLRLNFIGYQGKEFNIVSNLKYMKLKEQFNTIEEYIEVLSETRSNLVFYGSKKN